MSELTAERSRRALECSPYPNDSRECADVKSTVPAPLDHINDAILRELEADSRLTADAVAVRIGASPEECSSRIAELEKAGHIGGYTLVRYYPVPALRPISAVIRVVQDRTRTGADLMRSLDNIPEIVTAEVVQDDRSLLLRVHVEEPGRIEAIASMLRSQSAVVSVDVSRTTIVPFHPRHMSRPPL
jgi:DNA-binding Lrp family transcriptional regulator